MAKQRIAVLFGNASLDSQTYDPSVQSVTETLSANQYEVILLGVSSKGKWLYYPGDLNLLQNGDWEKHPDCCPCVFNMDGTKRGIYKILDDQSISFLHLDGVISLVSCHNGNVSNIPGLLEISDLPYVGSSTCSSAICTDKAFSHMILNQAGIQTARYMTIKRTDKIDFHQLAEEVFETFEFPVFVKPVFGCAEIFCASDEEQLEQAVKMAFVHDNKVLIEEMIRGVQVKCAVIGNDVPEASVLGEIPAEANDFSEGIETFDSSAPGKWEVSTRLSQDLSYRIRDIAVQAYRLLDCSGMAMIDFFVTPAEEIYLNQINITPDLSADALFMKLWEAVGISHADMLNRLISLAQERAEVDE